jgi:para-nitrobenzyl esterase
MATDPVVRTSHGRVRGSWQNGVQIFRGIPYGAPPIGSDRFLPPKPPADWTDVREAVGFGHYCPQAVPAPMWCDPRFGPYFTGGRAQELIDADIRAGEDCLVLNVLTPSEAGARPVMVYIHGGGFQGMCGSITTLADGLVSEQDVVLVSVNHRLNAFGFLYLGGISDRYAAGNVGLLDLVLALQWIRDNIAAFGGDPDNVTVFGESGGGSKILDLMAMEAAQGLFHRAIVQCTGWPDPFSRESATEMTTTYLDRLGVGTDLDRLAELPTQTLVNALTDEGKQLRFWSVLDGVTITESPWRDKAPEGSAHIPMLIGNARHEMTHTVVDQTLFALDWPDVLPQLVRFTLLPRELMQPVLDVYRSSRPDDSPSEVFVAIMSDRLREIGLRVTELHSAQQDAVYRYDFGYESPIPNLRAFHTSELPLALRLVRYPEAEAMSRRISAAWAGFARSSDPQHFGLPAWPTYHDRRATMMLDLESAVVHDPWPAEREAMAALPSLGTDARSLSHRPDR